MKHGSWDTRYMGEGFGRVLISLLISPLLVADFYFVSLLAFSILNVLFRKSSSFAKVKESRLILPWCLINYISSFVGPRL